MIQHKNRRILMAIYAAAVSMTVLTGFTSLAMEQDTAGVIVSAAQERAEEWDFADTAEQIHASVVLDMKDAAQEAQQAYIEKVEEERRAAEEAERLAREKAAEEARMADQRLLAALIFCEAGNQPYEGQVAVGAVVMNRINSGSYPNTIREVIYQSGQFGPAMTGWLDSVLAKGGYTDSAMQAAADAMAGSNPVGDCLYFGNGNWGLKIGDHYFH
ncbi:MAG TPA: cell wall hydrolase [Candidatus Mediterraneibacter cottocaccae]|nr:cell wall hydrolase [Candidatus Mediterraneibacter cottocaccae]